MSQKPSKHIEKTAKVKKPNHKRLNHKLPSSNLPSVTMILISAAKHHLRRLSNSKMPKVKFHDHQKALKQALLPQNQCIKSKATMMMNGLLWSSLILNCSKKKKSLKRWEKNSSRKRLKKNSISKWNKKRERKTANKEKTKSISNFNNNRPNFTMKDKKKKEKSINEKSSSKRKWETAKSKTKTRERKSKKRNRTSSITCLLPR